MGSFQAKKSLNSISSWNANRHLYLFSIVFLIIYIINLNNYTSSNNKKSYIINDKNYPENENK